MDGDALFSELRCSLIGRKVTFTRLAANSLILYVDCQPGDKQGYTIWFDPTWHMSGPEGVLVGSRQAQGRGGVPASSEELRSIGAPLDKLVEKPITAVDLDPRSRDLTLVVDDMYFIKTFVADPTDEFGWYIRDVIRRVKVYGSALKLSVRPIKDLPARVAKG